MVFALKAQADFYARKRQPPFRVQYPDDFQIESLQRWIGKNEGIIGEEALELLIHCGLPVAKSFSASHPEEAVKCAQQIGYPVVMKVISPDAIHKSEAGGVIMSCALRITMKSKKKYYV